MPAGAAAGAEPVWTLQGTRPISRVRRRSQWLDVSGFVRPTTGQRWWCLLPTVNVAAMAVVLAAFAADTGVEATHWVVLGLDGACWHTSGRLDCRTASIW